jgi:hypothetical protein
VAALIEWTGGGTATIESLELDRVTLVSSRAFAPGSRPEGSIEGAPGADAYRIWVKVHGSRRTDDGSFRVSGRILNATRELRRVLKEGVPDPNGGKSSDS